MIKGKVLSLGKFRALTTGGQGDLAPHFGLLKILFLEHHVARKKLTMMHKGIIIFYPTCLTKITYISSTTKFLNTESLVVQVSNTRSNIQSLHF